MKAICIKEENSDRLQLALSEVNGKSYSHVFSVAEIIALTSRADTKLDKLLLKQDFVGAQLHAQSGLPVAGAYDYSRNGNELTMERRPSGWFLTELIRKKFNRYQGGKTTLILTKEQDNLAVAKFRCRYLVRSETLATALTDDRSVSQEGADHSGRTQTSSTD